jgi:hypothetical protein
MAETTTGAGPVEQGPPSEAALEGILGEAFALDKPESAAKPDKPVAAPQEAEADAASDELTPDDLLEDEPAPQSADAAEFEIVHNGQQHKLTRAETIKLAQQGFDYTQKTQSVAEKYKAADAALAKVTEIEQLIPQVAQEFATVKAIEAQLKQYDQVDWVSLATNDPLEYPKHRGQYDQLLHSYQQANGQLQQKAAYVTEQKGYLTAQKMQQESAKLLERIPEWRDPDKYQSGAKELSSYLISQGADPKEVAALSDSLAVQIARKAMLYDKLVSAKADRSKQLRTAPPVVRPGAAVPSEQGKANFTKVRQEVVKLGRQGKHGQQQALMEAVLGRTFKK